MLVVAALLIGLILSSTWHMFGITHARPMFSLCWNDGMDYPDTSMPASE